MVRVGPSIDLRRSCLAAFLSRLATGARAAARDEFGRHAGVEIISAVDDMADAADALAAFLYRAPGALPPDAIAELFSALQIFCARLADALETRVPFCTLPQRGMKP